LLILFAAWQLWGTAITQHHSQSALQKQFEAKVAQAKPTPGFTLSPGTTQLTDPPEGTVMGQLQIPKIGLTEYVVSGTNTNDLNLGPGHYLHTAQPGQAGNVAIAGHRTTHGAPFNRLAELAPGDPIYLTTTTGHRLTYVVAAPPSPVSPTDVAVLNDFGDNRLTLTTCNPEFSARQRLIVVGAYQPPGAAHPERIVKGAGTPYHLAPAASSGWSLSLVPLVLTELALLVALGLFNRRLARTYGRLGRWLILIPVWAALVLALFETLTNFLPSAI
jgi:LPXTG-site transpeptidase (sortase) family protein